MTPARRRPAALAATLVASLLLAACGGLPTSSEVVQGDQVAPPVTVPPRQRPPAPVPGDSPESIVMGFVGAGSALSDDYRAARDYLAPALAEKWAPRSRTTMLYAGSKALTVTRQSVTDDEASVKLTVAVSATLDADGRYGELPEPEQRSVVFTLGKVAGQWRIRDFPQDFALWLDLFYFNYYYQPFVVAYSSPSSRTIIPDRRFFPVTATLPTSLARAQLDPVPGYLQGAATTGFPPMTRLAVDAVTVQGGIATLDLTAAVLDGGADERRAALAQAITTLTQATAVAGVSLQADGQPLTVVGAGAPPNDLATLGFQAAGGTSPEWVVARDGSRLDARPPGDLRGLHPGPQAPFLPAVDPTYTVLDVSHDLRDLAATAGDGASLIRWHQDGGEKDPGVSGPVPAFGTDLTRPSYDARHDLWIGGQALTSAGGGAALFSIDTRTSVPATQARRVEAPWLSGRTVVAVSAAPDGHRLAVVVKEADGRTRVAVTGVVRGPDDRPVSLTAPLMIAGQVSDAVALAWPSAYQVAILGRAGKGQELRTMVAGLDGRTELTEMPPVPGGRSLVALGSGRLAVVTSAGRVWVAVAGGWQDALAATDLAGS